MVAGRNGFPAGSMPVALPIFVLALPAVAPIAVAVGKDA